MAWHESGLVWSGWSGLAGPVGLACLVRWSGPFTPAIPSGVHWPGSSRGRLAAHLGGNRPDDDRDLLPQPTELAAAPAARASPACGAGGMAKGRDRRKGYPLPSGTLDASRIPSPFPLHSYNQNEFQNDFQHDSLIIFSSINLNVPKSQGLKSQVPKSPCPHVPKSQGPMVSRSKAPKLQSS